MNEGGLYGERQGWFLQAGGSMHWGEHSTALARWMASSKASVRFYVANFHLNMDNDLDAAIGVSLSSPNGTTA